MGLLALMVVIGISLLLPGVINRTRAMLAGRRGVRFFQHLHTLRAMGRKGVVTGHTTTFIFRTAPSVYLAALCCAALFMPVGGLEPLLHFKGDVVIVAYLLALSRLAIILAALDTGSSFEGMGASRDALYGAMVEPALFIGAGTLALLTGNTSFSDIFNPESPVGALSPELVIAILLLSYVFIRVLTVESGRIPVDDPRTHLELTMIHEVMILDYSGIDLAMITLGGWIKTGILALLAGNTVALLAANPWGSVAVTTLAALAVGLLVGINESFVARNRLSRNTTFILTIVAIAFVVFMVAYLLRQNISFG